MKTIAVIVRLVAVLTGCATAPQMQWVKHGSTQEEFRRDNLACRQYGMQSAMANGLAGNLFVESWIQREAANCLMGLGYTQQAIAQSADHIPSIAHQRPPEPETATGSSFQKPSYSLVDGKRK